MKKAIVCVYKIQNIKNGKMYIGSTNNFNKRKYQHLYQLRKNIHCNSHLQNAWNKYGESNFVFKIIEKCENDLKFKTEQKYLDSVMPFGDGGYNILKNASGGLEGNENLSYSSGEKCNLAKNKEIDVYNAKKLYSEGYLDDYVEEKTGINKVNLRNIKTLKSWKKVGSEFNDYLKSNFTKDYTEQKWIVCKMLCMGFGNKEIQNLTGISALSVAKYKRIGIFDDKLIASGFYFKCKKCGKANTYTSTMCKKCYKNKKRGR